MTSIRKLAQLAGLGLAAMGLVACGGGGSSSDGTGLMSLAVTDSPLDQGAERVVVRFTHVELQPVNDGERVVIYFDEPARVEEPATDDTVGAEVETLVEESVDESVDEPTQGAVREVDLLTLQGENSEPLFEEVEVPAGDYAWIRFYLEPETGPSSPPLSNFATSSYIEFEGGDRAHLTIPGGLQAGLQLVSGFTVPEGGSASFTVDFDLRNMIRPDNQFEGYYRMRRALRLVDNSNVGVITGSIEVGSYEEELSGVAATCTQDGDRCPGLSVSVYSADPVEENSDPEQDTGFDEGGDTTVEISSVEEPLTTANVFAQDLAGQWEYRYTVGFLSPGAYDLKLTLDEAILDEANGENVVAGGKTIVDFPVPVTDE
ncbi:DUF4382 domain-containing protein [Thioalkalivibrio sp.]|uniref:DUF4382 domain-containing protein n=1 Tax=Thioalkalivibrio sp. TaxID=2093813 RepID=UPI0035618128